MVTNISGLFFKGFFVYYACVFFFFLCYDWHSFAFLEAFFFTDVIHQVIITY